MKKVMQDVLGLGGNCQSATVATLLGLPLSSVPSFWDGCDIENPELPENGVIFNNNFNSFLAKYGLTSITLGLNDGDHSEWVNEISSNMRDVKLMVGGRSPRGFMHSVIYMNGELWHDPSPYGGGVIPCQITFIVPMFRGDVPLVDLQVAFRDGYTMGQEKMTHDENIFCWSTPQEAWTNSDTLEIATHQDCDHHWNETTNNGDKYRFFVCKYCDSTRNFIPAVEPKCLDECDYVEVTGVRDTQRLFKCKHCGSNQKNNEINLLP